MGVPSMQSRIFVDFWNFTLQWQSRSAGADADWRALPQVLHARTQEIVRGAGAADVLELEETLVYASYEPGRDDKLRDWLDSWLHPQPGFRVIGSERAWRPRSVHCRECGATTTSCPHCHSELGHAGEGQRPRFPVRPGSGVRRLGFGSRLLEAGGRLQGVNGGVHGFLVNADLSGPP